MRSSPNRFFGFATCAVCLIWLAGCPSAGGIGPLGAGATSQACTALSGAVAIQYDVQSGIATSQLTSIPVVATIGGNFIHPTYPTLGFIYPVGWAPAAIQSESELGVNLLRNDFQSMWRWVFAQVAPGTTAASVRELETSQLTGFFGAGGAVTTVCINEGSDIPAPGVNRQFSSSLVQWDTMTAIVATSTVFVDGLPGGSAFVQVTVSPTAEFDADIFATYLPIHFSLLVGNSSIVDSDGDGVSDTIDDFPFYATRS
jgi:hypothetical protein